MTDKRSPMTLLSIYGAEFSRWPESRSKGRLSLATSPAFRAAWRNERGLDRSLTGIGADTASAFPADGRMELRLLARMGIADAPVRERQAFGQRTFAGFAAASLCLGMIAGSLFGDIGVNSEQYASENATIWESVLDDEAGSDVG